MITKEESERIKDILGSGYSRKILDYISSKGIKNQHNKAYSTRHIINIVNGESNNNVIESAILVMCKKALLEQRKKTKIREELFSS